MAAILVVDDEPLIREMLTLILERGGFQVYSAANGAQALHKFHLYRGDIDLVITDVGLPGMDGRALAMRLLAEQPSLPMILMSDRYDYMDLGSHSTLRFLPKPFNLAALLSTVRSLVAEGRSFSAG